MKKKISVLLIIVLCLSAAFSALADTADGFADAYRRVIDAAQLLSDSEETALLEQLDEISLRQNMDVTVAAVNSLDGSSIEAYADLLYAQCQFGYGDTSDGLLLLISMEERAWYISTCGYGITAFTDAGLAYIGEKIQPALSEGSYAAAFTEYATLCDSFITQARSDTPYDSGNLPREPLSPIWLLVALLIGFVIAKISVGSMKSKLKTVRAQAAANSYVKAGSMQVTEHRDLFLYRTVTRTEKPKNNSSSGSSTHTAASGTTHGGKGGSF